MPTQNRMATKKIRVIYEVTDQQLVQAKKTIEGTEASTKKADAAVKKLGDDLKNSGEQGKKSFMDLRGVMDSIVAIGITSYFVSAGKAIFDLGVKQQQLNIAFEVFLGSASKAKKVIADLTQFAIVTPFTPDQVNGAAKALLAFGVSGEDVIPILKRLGDVSAGTGKDLTEMAIIFGQIRSTGRLMGQDLLQLINAGFNPLQVISEKTGKSVADLKKEMEKGLITFEMVDDAFKSATEEGGKFFNLMEKQSQSIGGKLSTITGNIEEVAKGIFENNIELLDTFITRLGIATDVLLNWVRTANSDPNFEKATKNAESYRKALDDAFKDFESGNGPDAINKALAENVKFTNEWEESVEFLAERVRHTTGDEFEKYNNQLIEEQATVKLLTQLTQEYMKKVQELGATKSTPVFDPKLFDKLAKEAEKYEEKIRQNERKLAEEGEKDHEESMNSYVKRAEDRAFAVTEIDQDQARVAYEIIQDQKKAYEEAEKAKEEAAKKAEENIIAARQRAADIAISIGSNLLQVRKSGVEEEIRSEQYTASQSIKLAGDNKKLKEEIEIKSQQKLEALRVRQEQEQKERDKRRILIDGLVSIAKTFAQFGYPAGILPAALMAAQTAIMVQTVGQYKDGEVDIQGPGTSRSDSINARISKGESVINAAATSRSKNLLTAINEKRIDDRILSNLRVGSHGIIAQMNDERIVKAIEGNRMPSLARDGYTLMETIQVQNGFKKRVRSKII